jgi:hypothetical protein
MAYPRHGIQCCVATDKESAYRSLRPQPTGLVMIPAGWLLGAAEGCGLGRSLVPVESVESRPWALTPAMDGRRATSVEAGRRCGHTAVVVVKEEVEVGAFEDLHRDRITGSLAMYDRMIFKGHLTQLYKQKGGASEDTASSRKSQGLAATASPDTGTRS